VKTVVLTGTLSQDKKNWRDWFYYPVQITKEWKGFWIKLSYLLTERPENEQ
jgi:hypothetical protein